MNRALPDELAGFGATAVQRAEVLSEARKQVSWSSMVKAHVQNHASSIAELVIH